MPSNVLGPLEIDGMQNVCSFTDTGAGPTPKVSEPLTIVKPATVAINLDQCTGWRCPGCRSCHSPKTTTCPVCDTHKNPLVPAHVERALEDALAAALNPLEDPKSLFPTVHVRTLLEAVQKLRQ